MKIARLAGGLGVMLWLGACAQRAPEASAPSASSTASSFASPPAAEAAPIAVPAGPPAAPAPQGLGDESGRRASDLDREYSSLEAAERALNQAQADLDRLALAEPSPSAGRSAPRDGAPEKKEKPTNQAPKASAAASAAPSALCENACRAFSSLSRAASAVCRLDGNGGTHCAHAKHVLADSQLRVASCACAGE